MTAVHFSEKEAGAFDDIGSTSMRARRPYAGAGAVDLPKKFRALCLQRMQDQSDYVKSIENLAGESSRN